MHFTPFENFRKFVVASPPWVIFTLSLVIMAFGVLILACRLRNDSYEIQPNLATAHYCVVTTNKIGTIGNENTTTAMTTNVVNVPVVISMKFDTYYELVNKSSTSSSSERIEWMGILNDGQLGFKATEPNATLKLDLVLESSSPYNCVDETCEYFLVQACAVIRGVTEHHKAHSTLDEDVGSPVCKNVKIGEDSIKSSMINWLDTATSDTSAMTNGQLLADGKWCENVGRVISVQRRDERGLVLIPLLHDTLSARLHLLYMSYFLFTTILVLIVYATCKKPTHSKHAVRTLESVHSNYSKLSNERE